MESIICFFFGVRKVQELEMEINYFTDLIDARNFKSENFKCDSIGEMNFETVYL